MRYADCHTDRKHFCKGLCRNCYATKFRRGNPDYVEYMRKYGRKYRRRPDKKDALRKLSRKVKLKAKYGLSYDAYIGMLDSQHSRCAICAKPLTANTANVDHCHATGRVRGLLCRTCNTGLGLFYDNPSILSDAIAYLTVAKTDLLGAK